jgi:hypothetical protein
MNKILVLRAFAKAEKVIKKRGVTKPSLVQMATELSDYLEEEKGFNLGEKSLRTYRGAAEKLKDQSEDISIKQLAVINGLCNYLDCDNYQEFVKRTSGEGTEIKPLAPKRATRWVTPVRMAVVVSALVLISLFIYNYSTRLRWMVWQEDHYVEVDFDVKKYSIKQLKPYKEERILSFKKVELTCETIFFNQDKSVRFWYGKNRNKELEFFTDLGLHPETGNTLKPITAYMIDKYVCQDP